MNTLIVVSHPEPRSLNWAMAGVIRETLGEDGNEVRLLDLHATGFDPVLRPAQFPEYRAAQPFEVMAEQARQARNGGASTDLAASQRLLLWSENLILQFPLWWWSVPATLKGWIDRVLSNGFAYGASNLEGRRAMLSVTAETKAERFAGSGSAHPLHHLERGTLGFCGYSVVPAFVVAEVHALSADQRRVRLDELRAHVRRHLRAID